MVGGNPPDHLGVSKKGLGYEPYFIGVNLGLVWVCGEKGLGIRVGGIWRSFKTFGRCKTLTWRVEEKNGERCTYLVCDLNGRWLKGSSFLCCIIIVQTMEGIKGHVI
jgi:hypothetical protein